MAEQLPIIRSIRRLSKPSMGITLNPRPEEAATFAARRPRKPLGLAEGGDVPYAPTAPYLPNDSPQQPTNGGELPLVNNPHIMSGLNMPTGPSLYSPHTADYDQAMMDAGPASATNGNIGVKPMRWDAKNQSWTSSNTPRKFLGLSGTDWIQVALAAGTGAGAGAAARGDRSGSNGLTGIRARLNNDPYQQSTGGGQSGYAPVSVRGSSPLGYADGGPIGDDSTDHNGPQHIDKAGEGGISPEAAAMMNPAGSAVAPAIGQGLALAAMFSRGGRVCMADGGLPPQQTQQPQGGDPQKEQIFMAAVAVVEGKIQDPNQAKAIIQAFVKTWGPQALQELAQHVNQGQGQGQGQQAPPQGGIASLPQQGQQAQPGMGMADGGSVWDFLNPDANAQQAILAQVPPSKAARQGNPGISLGGILKYLNPEANMQQAVIDSTTPSRPSTAPAISKRGLLDLFNPDANMQTAARGYASGGTVSGPGDGMSDQVAAQHAQSGHPIMLSNDEYVVPADAVAMLGNGSSHAGARKLDAGIAKLRKQKYGRAKQPAPLAPNSNPVLGQ